tara:strand:+ start:79 stop:516 length:438 start_codon:yes stop_codon:yes gene_type:complete
VSFSPFQQPSSRQNILASQIEVAESRADLHQLTALQSQWVHRYGIASLPNASKLVEDSSNQPVSRLEESPEDDGIATALITDEVHHQSEEWSPQSESDVSKTSPIAMKADLTSVSRGSVPAPPLSTPRSLRRWLPGADQGFPQAS